MVLIAALKSASTVFAAAVTAPDDRDRFVRAAWVNVAGNAAKILVEGAVGLTFGSVAVLADAAHSIADLVASVVVLQWGDSRYVAADAEHPHGHGRIEPLTALFVGAVIVLLGANLLYESGTGLLEGPTVTFDPLLIAATLVAGGLMLAVYWYTMRVNDALGAPALRALAIDCRNDIYTSAAVLVGIVGVGAGYPVFDPLAGGLVSVLVIYQGIEVARENLAYLAGEAAPPHRQEEVKRTLRGHPSVHGVHDLVVFYDGPHLEVEAHVEVGGELTLAQAHDIETELVEAVHELEGVKDVHIHLDPAGLGEWKRSS